VANLALRQADFAAAVSAMQTVIVNSEADIAAADSDSFEIGRLRDRVQSAIVELGILSGGGIDQPGN
jgi:hypothetical protein